MSELGGDNPHPSTESKGRKTILRKILKHGFTIIPNAILEERSLSWQSKGILCYLLSKPDNWLVRREDIRRAGTNGMHTVRGCLDELRKAGYLHLSGTKGTGGKYQEWEWTVADHPAFLPAKCPVVGKPDAGHRPISNTDGSKAGAFFTETREGNRINVTGTAPLERREFHPLTCQCSECRENPADF